MNLLVFSRAPPLRPVIITNPFTITNLSDFLGEGVCGGFLCVGCGVLWWGGWGGGLTAQLVNEAVLGSCLFFQDPFFFFRFPLLGSIFRIKLASYLGAPLFPLPEGSELCHICTRTNLGSPFFEPPASFSCSLKSHPPSEVSRGNGKQPPLMFPPLA